LGLLWTPLALLAPIPLKIAVDHVLGGEPLPGWTAWAVPAGWAAPPDALAVLVAATVILIAVATLVHNTGDWLLRETVSDGLVRDFRGRLLRHVLRMPTPASSEEGTGGTTYRINYDAPALEWTTIYGLMPILISSFSLVGILVMTARLSPMAAFIAAATAVPLILLIHRNQRRMYARWRQVKELESATHAAVQEVAAAVPVVVAFGQEDREVRRFLEHSQRMFRAKLGTMGLQGVFGALLSLATAAGTAAILYTSIREVQLGTLTTGEMVLIMAYVAQLYGPVQHIGSHLSDQQVAVAGVERAFELLDRPPAVRERDTGALPLKRARGEITLDQVSFGYAVGRPVITDLSLAVPAGSRVGIIGPTGCGKTTLLRLLNRFLDPEAGRILLDGIDIREYRLPDLRRQFAVVAQDTILFSGTIAENIAYGDPSAPRERIIDAAVRAQAHEFVARLPDGYDTRLGERGLTLSGGERQRIALARAYLKDAPVLLLDEPTSAVDAETERAILDSLEGLMKGRTTFLVTHRVAALRDMDLVLRLVPDAQVVEYREVAGGGLTI
jgi:ATP-binding cassette subfamily B protein